MRLTEYDADFEHSILVAGTFNGNPLTIAAGTAVLQHLNDNPQLYEKIDAMGDRFRREINVFARQQDFPAIATGIGSMFAMHPVPGLVNNVRDLHQGDRAVNSGLGLLYRQHGLHISPSHGFMSAAHADEDITRLIEIYKSAMVELRTQGMW
jgi:glutamate-1-semialdehyde aminotransferase